MVIKLIIIESVLGHPNLVKRYSNQGYLIQNDQTGAKYSEAIDVAGLYTYTETSEGSYEDIPPLPDQGFQQVAEYLLKTRMIGFVESEEDRDYFNEKEQEPNYFG